MVRSTDRPDMILVVYRGRKQQNNKKTYITWSGYSQVSGHTLRKHLITLWYTLYASISLPCGTHCTQASHDPVICTCPHALVQSEQVTIVIMWTFLTSTHTTKHLISAKKLLCKICTFIFIYVKAACDERDIVVTTSVWCMWAVCACVLCRSRSHLKVK